MKAEACHRTPKGEGSFVVRHGGLLRTGTFIGFLVNHSRPPLPLFLKVLILKRVTLHSIYSNLWELLRPNDTGGYVQVSGRKKSGDKRCTPSKCALLADRYSNTSSIENQEDFAAWPKKGTRKGADGD
jgi:hypothetical protein